MSGENLGTFHRKKESHWPSACCFWLVFLLNQSFGKHTHQLSLQHRSSQKALGQGKGEHLLLRDDTSEMALFLGRHWNVRNWKELILIHTSVLMCFAIWQCQGHTVLGHFDICHGYFENLVHPEQTQKSDCVYGLECSSCKSTTPLMKPSSILARKRCVGMNFPVLGEVIVIVQILQNALKN